MNDHCVMNTALSHFECRLCGATLPLMLLMGVHEFVRHSDKFIADHEGCTQKPLPGFRAWHTEACRKHLEDPGATCICPPTD